MDRYLQMNDGTILKDSYALESRYGLIVNILDESYNIIKAFSLLTDQEAVRKILYHYYKAELTFEGYTNIVSIQIDRDRITAILTKEKDGANDGE